MIGARVRTCTVCHGAGKFMPDARACTWCAGVGRVVVCEGCGDEMPLPEARGQGAFCADCCDELDIREEAS